jgi:uncharacterized membrane protein
MKRKQYFCDVIKTKTNNIKNTVMKAIIGKQIGDVKVTGVKNDVVRYSKKIWQGSWRRSISMTMQLNDFAMCYPNNVEL